VTIVGLIIGGVMIFSFQKKEQTFEEQIQHEQERMALYLMNHYEGINEIEFNDIENNASTGSRAALLTINKEFKMEIAFFKFNDKTDNYVISWDKRLNLQEKNETTNQQTIGNIRVKYWGK
jgi:hypothetical protein